MRIRIGESIFYDFTKDGEDSTDSQSCNYFVRDDNNTDILTGELEKQDNTFMLRITNDDTSTLVQGKYTLLVSFSDSDSGYYDFILDEVLEII